jgi:hypothetical protein
MPRAPREMDSCPDSSEIVPFPFTSRNFTTMDVNVSAWYLPVAQINSAHDPAIGLDLSQSPRVWIVKTAHTYIRVLAAVSGQ